MVPGLREGAVFVTGAGSAAIGARLPARLRRAWAWARVQPFNPVFVREARSIFRGQRVVRLQLIYLLALMVAMGLASLLLFEQRGGYGALGARATLPEFGRWMFVGQFETQAVLLLLIAVGYSAGCISLEREKQTYDMLAITGLSSAEVVLGKVASITLLCYLLMVTSAPLASFCLLFGGVSPGEIALGYGLLAMKIPLWASLGVLASVLAGRSIPAYIITLIAVVGENSLSLGLMDPGGSPVCMGLFSPFAAPAADELTFELFGRALPPWLLPVPYAVLLTALTAVGAAEAMLHYRPKRSALLRSLLLATIFFVSFLLSAIVISAGPLPLIGLLALSWVCTAAFIPVFTSYPPEPGSAEEPSSPARAALNPRTWLRREAVGGAGFCLLLWLVALLGMGAAATLASALGHSGLALSSYSAVIPALCLALVIYAMAIVAYSAWGTVLAVVNTARREVALATALLILLMNALAVVYAGGVHVMRKVPSQASLVLASPAAAASAALAQTVKGSVFRRYSLDEAFGYGLGYSLLLLAGAWWYYRRAAGRGRLSSQGAAEMERRLPGRSAGK